MESTLLHPYVIIPITKPSPPDIESYSHSKGDPMTTFQHPSTRQQNLEGEYITRFYIELRRLLNGRFASIGLDVDDIVSYACVNLCGKVVSIMSKHPCPVTYARLHFKNATLDYGRRQAAQRGEGARRTRKGASTASVHIAAELERSLNRGGKDFTAQAEDRLLVNQIMASLPHFQQKVLRLCEMDGHTTIAAARILGVRRETVSRALSKAKQNTNKTCGAAA